MKKKEQTPMMMGNFPIPEGAEKGKRDPTGERSGAEAGHAAAGTHGDLTQANWDDAQGHVMLFCETCKGSEFQVGTLKRIDDHWICAACFREKLGYS